MRKITQLLTALVFCSLLVFISCGGDDDGDGTIVDPRIEIGENLVSVATGAPSSVTFNGSARDEWDSFSITFTFNKETFTGTYTVTGVPTDEGAADVWGASGTWSFNADGSVITTGDGIAMTANVSANSASLSFDNSSLAKVDEFYGAWVFTWQ